MKKIYYFFIIYSSFFVILGIYELANPPFSNQSATIGSYQIQLKTTPSVPQVGNDTDIHFRILDENGNEIDKFRMGLQIYYNDKLMKSFLPESYYSGSWDFHYVFQETGNHVLRIDLSDLKNLDKLSYSFNVAVLNFFGTMFSYLIISGVAGAVGIILAIIISQKRPKARKRQ